MLIFLLRRLAVKAALVFAATSLAYLLASVTLNPAAVYLGRGRDIPQSAIDASLDAYNVNPKAPLPARCLRWLEGALHGDFGMVYQTQEAVISEMGRRAGVSLRLLAGATFVETIFNWNGMGQWAVQSISNSDVNAVAAISGFVAVLVLVSGVLADVLHALLDPRVRA
ncbi:ABC transporter permease subunit [Nonomuraea pusilla]|uniref:ABC transporter permease subunit n=1 Tax=Nonomuraea pusilla TaxID=46177 RepID=UPI0033217E15